MEILSGLFSSPAEWMSVCGILFMLGMGGFIYRFVRKKIREEEQG